MFLFGSHFFVNVQYFSSFSLRSFLSKEDKKNVVILNYVSLGVHFVWIFQEHFSELQEYIVYT